MCSGNREALYADDTVLVYAKSHIETQTDYRSKIANSGILETDSL